MKRAEITVKGRTYERIPIKTHFVTENDDCIELLHKYVSGLYRPGDIVSISEKIVSLCQHRIVRREDVKVGRLAKFLSRFADRDTSHGLGVGAPIKMQYAIDKKGAPRIISAAIVGGLCKLFGVKGVFYMIAGREVSGLDGFYGGVWDEYRDIGIELPRRPDDVCDEIKRALGISCMIVDANDLGQVILGKSSDIALSDRTLVRLIKDNPAGQGREMTPIVIIREKGTAAQVR